LQHDNAQLHTARETVATIEDLHLECPPHLPQSPDLAPSDYHIFGPLKEVMGRKTFRSDEEVQQVVYEWLHMRPKYLFFLEESMHFVSTRGLVSNAMEAT
jgi:hypothetical protein